MLRLLKLLKIAGRNLFRYKRRTLLMISGIVIIVSIPASLQPAVKASRMDPIRAPGHI